MFFVTSIAFFPAFFQIATVSRTPAFTPEVSVVFAIFFAAPIPLDTRFFAAEASFPNHLVAHPGKKVKIINAADLPVLY